MARPTKQGLDYFPFDVGFFGDKNIRILKARYRSDGIAVYVKLLCDIYKEGYFLSVEHWGDYVFVIADEIGSTPDKVEQIITFLRNRAMVRIFEKDELTGYDLDAVITSHGIQSRYAVAVKSRRKKGVDEIKRGFWLLSEDEEKEINAFYKRGINEGFSEKNPDKSEKTPDKSEKNPLKEIKEKENICTDVPRAKEDFFKRFSNLIRSGDVDDRRIDYQRLTDCFNRSKKFLQTRRCFTWIMDHYDEIVAGKYDDLPEAEPSGKIAIGLSSTVEAVNAKSDRERYYALRREEAQTVADRFLERANANLRFKAITTELAKMEISLAKAEVFDPKALPALTEEKAALLRERATILEGLGITEAELTPQYGCKKCSDTGFLKSGAACDCYKKEWR